MTEYSLLMVRISEIAVKSPKTRRRFLSALVSHINYILKLYSIQDFFVSRTFSNIFVRVPESYSSQALNILSSLVPGIASVSNVVKVSTEEDKIFEAIKEKFLPKIEEYNSFAVRVRRTGEHNFTSIELAAKIGSFILDSSSKNLKVDLTHPDYTLFVDVRHNDTFIYEEKHKGLSGLPAETQGKALVIIRTKEKDLQNILELYTRGVTSIVILLKEQEVIDKAFIQKLKKLLLLQPSLKRRKNSIHILPRSDDIYSKIISIYEQERCLALSMPKDIFFEYEKYFPPQLPIFVPDLAPYPINSSLAKVLHYL